MVRILVILVPQPIEIFRLFRVPAVRMRSRSAPESGAQCRNLNLQIVFLDDAIRPYALDQGLLTDDRSLRIDQCHEHVKSTPADLDWSSVGKELAAARRARSALI